MRGISTIPFALLLLTGCRSYDIPDFVSDTTLSNVTIGDLRSYCDGARITFSDDIIFSGYVISSDRAGNFYNTFFIDDGTGAAEIMAGMSDLHATYRPGQRIVVRARGLAVGWGNGAMQIGLPPEAGSGFDTGYFYHEAVIREYISRDRFTVQTPPLVTDIPSLTKELCGRLVRIENLTADGTGITTWAETKPSPATGYVKFRSSASDSITVVTSGYASFASMSVPTGSVSLSGILLYGKGGSSKDHYLLKLRDGEDIDLATVPKE